MPGTRFILFITLLFNAAIAVAGNTLEDGAAAYDAKRYTDAYQIWLPLAEKGDAEAQYNIALLYLKGLGIKKDARKAMEWLHKAARQGMTDAQYNIGVLYYEGKGAYRSEKSAIEWWHVAADNDHPNAQYNLGVMYAYGTAVKKDPDKALQLWQAAARQQHPDAIAALIHAYEGGLTGIAPDPAKAQHWRQQAGNLPSSQPNGSRGDKK